MTERSEKYWYQNGGLIFVIVGVAALVLWSKLNPQRDLVDVRLSGRIDVGLFTSPRFVLQVWHQHPGDLNRGRLRLTLSGKGLPDGELSRVHSFEIWPPNESQAVPFEIPLVNYDPAQPLRVQVAVEAANVRTTRFTATWQRGRWLD